ncbi:helix-turn-helix domain-containing protein [Paenibacillus oralis]|uniref:helix-turn-helix domain-containing protein n=1 Tax=Paenibacillus oralis TaxID=2490856 RepID=UPI000FFC1B6E|nr:AraC family transcriptional regulator [Paenibacillus oralis]
MRKQVTPVVDLNELAKQFAAGELSLQGVYFTHLQPGIYKGHTKSRPTPYAGLVFALRGQAVFTFDNTPYELQPGLIVHGPRGMALQVEVGPGGFEYALIHYTLDSPAGSSPDAYTRTHYMLDTGEQPRIMELLRLLQTSMTTPGPLQAVRSKELFYGTVYEMLSCARSRLNAGSRSMIEHALGYIHEHYMEPLNLKTLAGLYEMDVKKFAYAFRKYAGMFPIDYLIRHRMSRARQLLVATSCSVSEIAESVGYGDAHYFSRLFRKHTGCSPSEFRAQSGNNPPLF